MALSIVLFCECSAAPANAKAWKINFPEKIWGTPGLALAIFPLLVLVGGAIDPVLDQYCQDRATT